jgi:High potential iron-sulfur protein
MTDELPPRRAFLRLLSLGAIATLAGGRVAPANAAAAALVPLTGADPTAQALGYTDDSSKVDAASNPTHKPDQKCSSCVQYQGKPGDARGGCNIYAGKSVSANGWCKVWAKKPGS